MNSLPCKKLDSRAHLPTRAHPDDAGLDLYGIETVEFLPGQGRVLRTGIALELPVGSVGIIKDRSSLGKKGLMVAGGVVDAGYRGEIQVILWNGSNERIILYAGERIAQLLILPILTPTPVEVTELSDTVRGTGGFGSTGR
jgi:dUTP pyrophosphatase